MEIRHLTVFLAVAEERNFTRASNRLHTTQSAVSATIHALEVELGTELFDRSARQVRVTDAGLALVPKARSVLDAVADAKDGVDAVKGTVTGTVSVGFMTSVTLVDIPRLLGGYADRYPDVRVSLRASERGTAGLAELLSSGELDIAFLADSASPPTDTRMIELDSSPLLLAVTPDHRLAQRTSIELADLAGETFIDLPLGFGTRSIVDLAFANAGLQRDVRFETVDIAAAAGLARNGLGVAFLPEFVAAEPGLRALTVRGEDLRLTVSVAISESRRLSRAAQLLWDLAITSP
ncbi:LysR family transcriptional regulator [Diaminobutyricibacter tongyongensis]|uniref:LysR family transcriptional regulator n=1 Tax=Leifsonia tongyongensis TaxID=1268043 RepID=A0A6L9XWC5_9MICO|nr:LysR family transcriptional regulator [Diaminobutyricibacter tongyongensis]NEN05730.1 LysR family transcriptional regulator [Diaminobutyricibacter tongyongensis]